MGKRITIKEIAERSQTSKTTVSFYLNGKVDKMSKETRERIAKVIEETNYQPSVIARTLNSKSSHLIGVIIGDITNTFANQIVKGIDDYARSQSYQLVMGNSNYLYENEEIYVERMLSMGVDGFIVQPSSKFRKIAKKLEAMNKEVVYIDSQTYDHNGKWVKVNNYEATYQAISHCLEIGYEDFIMISAEPSLLSTRIERASGFVDALEENDLKGKSMIVEEHTSSDEIGAYLKKEVDLQKKTLVFAPNCWVLPKVFMALKPYREYIPNQIGLIGFDNTEWSEFAYPTITSIVQPSYEEGFTAAGILIDQIEQRNEIAITQTLECTINWCDSTR